MYKTDNISFNTNNKIIINPLMIYKARERTLILPDKLEKIK